MWLWKEFCSCFSPFFTSISSRRITSEEQIPSSSNATNDTILLQVQTSEAVDVNEVIAVIEGTLKNVTKEVQEAYREVEENVMKSPLWGKSPLASRKSLSHAIDVELKSLENSLANVWSNTVQRLLSDYLFTSETFRRYIMGIVSEDNMTMESQTEEDTRKLEIIITRLSESMKHMDKELFTKKSTNCKAQKNVRMATA